MNRPTDTRSVFIPVDLACESDFALGPLQVRPSLRRVVCNGREEAVQPRVMQVLVALARAKGGVVSREELIETCWDGVVVGDDSITHCIAKVRQLADCGGVPAFDIETIPRVGYRLVSSAPAAPPDEADRSIPPTAVNLTAPSRTKAPYLWITTALLAVAFLALVVYETRIHPAASPASSAGSVQASIAVLPFKNLSSDKDAGYLADGVQDEVLTRLAKIGSLRVISRTSTEQFANHAPSIRDIARKLGVANVLEGNVQKSGNRIRINVQLIRTANDDHLWAEDYDRNVDDMLSVESDVAGTIAHVLAAKMTPHERAEIAAKPTNNPRAYDLYLRALVFANKNEPTSLQTATQLLTEATRLDPKFALAWARLARNEAYRHFGEDLATVRNGAAHAALAKALALQPDLPEVQTAKGFYLYHGEMNYPAAERQLRFVNARWPNNAEAMEALALVLRRQGKWKESADVFERLLHLDPLSPRLHLFLSIVYDQQRDFARSIEVVDRALQIWPDDEMLLTQKAGLLLQLGQLDAAGDVLKNVHPAPDDADVIGNVAFYFSLKRQYAKGAAYFRGLLAIEQQGENRESVTCGLRMTIGGFLRMEGDAAGARENYYAALSSIQNELKLHPDDMNFLGMLPDVYAGLGQSDKAFARAEENIRMLRASKNAVDLDDAEGTYTGLKIRFGSRSDAIAEIARLLKESGPVTRADLRLDPDFDRLRGDPRFEALAHGKDVQVN